MTAKYTFKPTAKRKYHRDSTMSKAEIMLIMILFHDSGYRCLKHFYQEKVCKHMRHFFPKVVSYNRFVELEKDVAIPLAILIKKVLLGKCTGISFVDSTPLRVCKNKRIHIHKTFKEIAQRGKCSMGWFFGFKLHLICNERGELLNFMITPGDVDDRKPLEYKAFVEFIYGKLVGDNRLRVKKELKQIRLIPSTQFLRTGNKSTNHAAAVHRIKHIAISKYVTTAHAVNDNDNIYITAGSLLSTPITPLQSEEAQTPAEE